MSSPYYESADLLIKLYDLRREAMMREARDWFAFFNPETYEDVTQALQGPHGGHFRMVTSYWDMAASLVRHGAIDEQMFNDANGEQVVVFAKIEPFLTQHREAMGSPSYLAHLEKVVMKMPNAPERLAEIRNRFKQLARDRG